MLEADDVSKYTTCSKVFQLFFVALTSQRLRCWIEFDGPLVLLLLPLHSRGRLRNDCLLLARLNGQAFEQPEHLRT